VNKKRPISPNFGFMKKLIEYEKYLFGKNTFSLKEYICSKMKESFFTHSLMEIENCYDIVNGDIQKLSLNLSQTKCN
jgi:hypothetical protein